MTAYIIIAALGGILLGAVVSHILAVVYATRVVNEHSKIVRELIVMRDGAMAMLGTVKDEVQKIGNAADRKRVVLSEDLDNIKNHLGLKKPDQKV